MRDRFTDLMEKHGVTFPQAVAMAAGDRLGELERRAWRLLIHDAIGADRDGGYLCSEGKCLLRYFEEHGVDVMDLDEEDKFTLKRISPHESMHGDIFKRD
jgi:hypothetical protein